MPAFAVDKEQDGDILIRAEDWQTAFRSGTVSYNTDDWFHYIYEGKGSSISLDFELHESMPTIRRSKRPMKECTLEELTSKSKILQKDLTELTTLSIMVLTLITITQLESFD